MIIEYNAAVDELFVSNGIAVTPPPSYEYFQAHLGELADGIHPNGTGYQSMANLWFIALTRVKVSLSEEPLLKSTSTPVWQWYDRIVFAQGSTLPLTY